MWGDSPTRAQYTVAEECLSGFGRLDLAWPKSACLDLASGFGLDLAAPNDFREFDLLSDQVVHVVEVAKDCVAVGDFRPASQKASYRGQLQKASYRKSATGARYIRLVKARSVA